MTEKRNINLCLNDTKDLMDDFPDLYEKLYEHFLNSGEMPYGTAKARTGMPDVWILDHISKFL